MAADRTGPFATDLEKYYTLANRGHRSPAARVRLWVFNIEMHCVASFRFGQAARRVYAESRLRGLLPVLLATLWQHRVARIHHAHIDPAARIGPGFYIVHRNGLFIGPVVIGANCTVHHNLTIGQRVADGGQGVPTIGDNVWIGPGVTISGDVTVGDNVTISAGSVLSKSVPDGALVAGNPGRVIARDYDNGSILNFTVPRQRGPEAVADSMGSGE